jgi:hypothetical protein
MGKRFKPETDPIQEELSGIYKFIDEAREELATLRRLTSRRTTLADATLIDVWNRIVRLQDVLGSQDPREEAVAS